MTLLLLLWFWLFCFLFSLLLLPSILPSLVVVSPRVLCCLRLHFGRLRIRSVRPNLVKNHALTLAIKADGGREEGRCRGQQTTAAAADVRLKSPLSRCSHVVSLTFAFAFAFCFPAGSQKGTLTWPCSGCCTCSCCCSLCCCCRCCCWS